MPRRGIAALAITTVALILLLSFKTPDDTLPLRGSGVAVVEPSSGATSVPVVVGDPSPTQAPTGGAQSPTSATADGSATSVDGPVVSTRFGPIQVEIVVHAGQVTDVVAIQLPTGRRSGQISQYSAPILREEALQAQSASIDVVSGATYTSDAYAQSLQAALDEAGLG